jgi:hypothetical protein
MLLIISLRMNSMPLLQLKKKVKEAKAKLLLVLKQALHHNNVWGSGGTASHTSHFAPGERTSGTWIGDWVGTRGSLLSAVVFT